MGLKQESQVKKRQLTEAQATLIEAQAMITEAQATICRLEKIVNPLTNHLAESRKENRQFQEEMRE